MYFDIPVYPNPPHYAIEDLKLQFGNEKFKEFEVWVEMNVPASRRVKDGVAVVDVDSYMNRRRFAGR